MLYIWSWTLQFRVCQYFEWTGCIFILNKKGIIDLLFINECKVSSENSFIIILNNGKEKLFYEIICEDKEKNSIYVEALNYITHVTKVKLQSLKKYN